MIQGLFVKDTPSGHTRPRQGHVGRCLAMGQKLIAGHRHCPRPGVVAEIPNSSHSLIAFWSADRSHGSPALPSPPRFFPEVDSGL